MPEYEISFSMKKTPYTTVEGVDKDEVFDNANEVILNFEDHESGYDFAQWVVENLIIHVKEVKE